MIVRPAPALPPDEAARRVARAADPIWLSSPGASLDTGIAFDVVSAAPARVVRGGSVAELEAAWAEARARWAGGASPAPGWGGPRSPAAPDAPPPETPIGVGWLSYDLGRRWLLGAAAEAAPGGWPEMEMRFFDAIWVRAAGAPEARILAVDRAAADDLAGLLSAPAPPQPPPVLGTLAAAADEPPGWYPAAVARIKDYLLAGDAYQVNLARRLTSPIGGGDPVWPSATLRRRAPAPHAVWLGSRSAPGGAIDRGLVGGSPERFLRVDPDGRVETRPIKGTRPRGADPAADAAARAALLASPKDRAEHVMIVDLERNDLGRVCTTGSVVVDDLLRVVELPTVHHLVTTVRGRLRPEVGLGALLGATFPGGSITGAPKRRAMEIIDELEPAPRGIYTGTTGWLGAAGDLDLAIAIRTAIIAGGHLSLSVGGGIVADSDPTDELAETEVKARSFQTLWL